MTTSTRIVFYDGHCALCNGTVRWLIRLDRHHVLHYAPLQGETAERLLGSLPLEVDAMVYWRQGKPSVHASDAIGTILGDLAWPWPWGRVVLGVPKAWREAVYRALAQRRYRLFGRYESCPLPDPALKDRFLS